MEMGDRRFQVYLLVAVALGLQTWDITFNLGVYGTVFFDKIFAIWVISTTTLLAYWLLDDSKPRIQWYVQIALITPSIMMIMTALDASASADPMVETLFVIGYLSGFILSLPITLYVVLLVTLPDIIKVRSPKMIGGLIGIILTIAVIGYVVGMNHYFFLTCWDFEISGNYVPDNCRTALTAVEQFIEP